MIENKSVGDNRVKLIARSLMMSLLLVGLATQVLAQNPAVRMTPGPTKECVKALLKNLIPGPPLVVTVVELAVFDQKTCKRLCAFRRVINQKIEPCQSISLAICCPHTLPAASGYIYWLRVRGTGTSLLTEDWLFTP
jgi:hypothetical protein